MFLCIQHKKCIKTWKKIENEIHLNSYCDRLVVVRSLLRNDSFAYYSTRYVFSFILPFFVILISLTRSARFSEIDKQKANAQELEKGEKIKRFQLKWNDEKKYRNWTRWRKKNVSNHFLLIWHFNAYILNTCIFLIVSKNEMEWNGQKNQRGKLLSKFKLTG